MTNTRVFSNNHWFGINWDNVCGWEQAGRIDGQRNPLEGYNIHIDFVGGTHKVIYWNNGAQEVYEFLMSAFAPLNDGKE